MYPGVTASATHRWSRSRRRVCRNTPARDAAAVFTEPQSIWIVAWLDVAMDIPAAFACSTRRPRYATPRLLHAAAPQQARGERASATYSMTTTLGRLTVRGRRARSRLSGASGARLRGAPAESVVARLDRRRCAATHFSATGRWIRFPRRGRSPSALPSGFRLVGPTRAPACKVRGPAALELRRGAQDRCSVGAGGSAMIPASAHRAVRCLRHVEAGSPSHEVSRGRCVRQATSSTPTITPNLVPRLASFWSGWIYHPLTGWAFYAREGAPVRSCGFASVPQCVPKVTWRALPRLGTPDMLQLLQDWTAMNGASFVQRRQRRRGAVALKFAAVGALALVVRGPALPRRQLRGTRMTGRIFACDGSAGGVEAWAPPSHPLLASTSSSLRG